MIIRISCDAHFRGVRASFFSLCNFSKGKKKTSLNCAFLLDRFGVYHTNSKLTRIQREEKIAIIAVILVRWFGSNGAKKKLFININTIQTDSNAKPHTHTHFAVHSI